MRTRILSTTALTLALGAALTGCGSSGGSTTKVMTAGQVATSVIALEDLGTGFKVDSSPDDNSKTNFGCLEGLDSLDKNKIKAPRSKETDYAADSEIGVPAVFSKVGSFATADTAASILTKFKAAVDGCTSVDATDTDGFHVKLTVTTDETTSGPGATRQVNMTASGTGTTQGLTFPFGIRMSAIQVGNDITLVGFVSFGNDIKPEADKICSIALERLVAVLDGKKPSPAPANLHVVTESEILGGGSSSGA
ncbi:MAG: hypothetical protein ACJ72E_05615 [Marmoricola sp.]